MTDATRPALPESELHATEPAPWTTPSAPVDHADPLRRRRLAAAVALEAVLLGFAGDGLLKTEELGINFLLWCLCAVVAFVSLARRRGEMERRWQWALVAPVVFFSAVFAWRDSEQLLVLNMLALLSAFGVLALAFLGHPADIRQASVREYLEGAFGIGFSGAFGVIPLVANDGALRDTASSPRRKLVFPLLRGLVLAVPVLLVFGALLSSADVRFETLIRTVFDIDAEATVGHLLFAAFIAWVTAGYLRGSLIAYRPLGITAPSASSRRPTLGIVELTVPLALLNVLFAAFVVLQLPYLFGGIAHLRQVAGLTMANYARHGFFELVAVAALLLPLLLLGSALVKPDAPRDQLIFRWLARVTLGLLAVMMLSALQRMQLYRLSFGLTSDRIYATAVMLWLGIVFALFAFTVLRGRHAGFAFGAILTGWMTLAVLDVVNPDALIVRTNVERAANGAELDAKYVSSLSADAVPELARALHSVDPATQCVIAKRLLSEAERRERGLPTDWRWWNWSRSRSFRVAYGAVDDARVRECAQESVSR